MTAEQQLAESALQGKLIEGEMERKMLKEQRLQAAGEAELQKQYSAARREAEAERLLLEAEREKLKAAKALIDLDLESTVNKSVKVAN